MAEKKDKEKLTPSLHGTKTVWLTEAQEKEMLEIFTEPPVIVDLSDSLSR